jgi:peptidoglycan hydrolase-like protein with peptidoglycan-binding domain
METFAFLQATVQYEDPNPVPQLRSPEAFGAMIPSPTQMGATAGAIALTLMAAAPYASATVRRGDTCPQVGDVQRALSNAGFNPGGIDSVFGSRTQDAVIRFQRSRGLTPDGEVGLSTAAQLGLADPEDTGSVYAPGRRCQGGGGGGGTRVTVTTNGSPLNARSGPGTNFSVVRTYPNGSVLSTNGVSSNGWLQLVDGSWVAGNWVTSGGGGGGTNPGTGTVQVTTNGSPLNARSGPGLGFPVVTSYANGSVLTTTGNTSNGWIQLTNGLWISGNWVNGSSGGSTGGGGGGGVVRTNGSGLNARFGPGLNFGIGASYTDGTRLSLTGRSSNGWLELTNGLWVDGTWVS